MFVLWLSQKYFVSDFYIFKYIIYLCTQNGLLAEWLGIGLQNRLQRFESARDLNKNILSKRRMFFYSVQFVHIKTEFLFIKILNLNELNFSDNHMLLKDTSFIFPITYCPYLS